MIIYSASIDRFLKKYHRRCKQILCEEMGIAVYKKRFEYRELYPIHLVCFEKPGVLGYFAPDNFQIGLSKKLLLEPEKRVINVLRHELAHYMQFLLYGETVAIMDLSFGRFAKTLDGMKKFIRQKISLNGERHSKRREEREILSRIKKLLALAKSENLHEAEAATIKANELMAQYQIEEDLSAKKITLMPESITSHGSSPQRD